MGTAYKKWCKKPHLGQDRTLVLSVMWLGAPRCDSTAVLHSTGMSCPSPGPATPALQSQVLNAKPSSRLTLALGCL